MNNCTKFASIWMKFSNISLPTGPQAADPALPLKFKMGTSSSYVAPNCFRTQNPKSHVLKLRFARHKAKASEKIYSQPDFEFQASPSPLYLCSWEQWAAFAHVKRLYVHSYLRCKFKALCNKQCQKGQQLSHKQPRIRFIKKQCFYDSS